jgi:hypothetical protein
MGWAVFHGFTESSTAGLPTRGGRPPSFDRAAGLITAQGSPPACILAVGTAARFDANGDALCAPASARTRGIASRRNAGYLERSRSTNVALGSYSVPPVDGPLNEAGSGD